MTNPLLPSPLPVAKCYVLDKRAPTCALRFSPFTFYHAVSPSYVACSRAIRLSACQDDRPQSRRASGFRRAPFCTADQFCKIFLPLEPFENPRMIFGRTTVLFANQAADIPLRPSRYGALFPLNCYLPVVLCFLVPFC